MKSLLIGIDDYNNCSNLKNATNDATDLNAKLNLFGFETQSFINCSLLETQNALTQFEKDIKGTDVALFYFAGHGFQVKGENFLAVNDSQFDSEVSAQYTSIPVSYTHLTLPTKA